MKIPGLRASRDVSRDKSKFSPRSDCYAAWGPGSFEAAVSLKPLCRLSLAGLFPFRSCKSRAFSSRFSKSFFSSFLSFFQTRYAQQTFPREKPLPSSKKHFNYIKKELQHPRLVQDVLCRSRQVFRRRGFLRKFAIFSPPLFNISLLESVATLDAKWPLLLAVPVASEFHVAHLSRLSSSSFLVSHNTPINL